MHSLSSCGNYFFPVLVKTLFLYLFLELSLPDYQCNVFLPCKTNPSQRFEATESPDWLQGSHKVGWLWVGKIIWHSCTRLHPWGMLLNVGIVQHKSRGIKIHWLANPTCSFVPELQGRSSMWPSRRHTRASLAAAIRLMSWPWSTAYIESGFGFCGGRKTGEPREKPLKHGREPTNSTHLGCQVRESNPGP